MRCFVAKCLAAVTGVAILALAMLFGYLQSRAIAPSAGAPSAETAPGPAAVPVQPEAQPAAILARGREIYRRERCGACHSIGGEGNRRSPLDGVGTRLDRETIRRWIVEPQAMNQLVRKPSYDTLSEEDLAALIAYLAAPGTS